MENMGFGGTDMTANDRVLQAQQSQGAAQGRSSQEFTEEALQPALTETSLAPDSPSTSSVTQLNNSEQLPAPALDLTLLSDPQAQSLEDTQVKQGTLLMYSGSFDEADEYFSALKHIQANPRFSLHSAQAVLLKALLSLDPAVVLQADSLLVLVEKQAVAHIAAWNGLAFQTQKAKLTKAVATSLTSVKAAVGSPLKGMQTSLKAMVTKLRTGKEMSAVATTDDVDAAQYDDEKVIGATYTIPVLEVKEQRRKEWQRQKAVARCTALQAEATLLQGLLQVSVEGESAMGDEQWGAALKLGLGIRKAWNLYQSCQKQIEKVTALEAAAAAAEEADQQKQKKDTGRSVRPTADGELSQQDEGQELASEQERSNSNRGRKGGVSGTGLVEKIIGREPPPGEEVAPLVEEAGPSEAPKSSGAKQSLTSKWFGKGSANKSEGNSGAQPSRDVARESNGEGADKGADFWTRAKGFIKKKIGKRGEDDSDSDEERRVRRQQPIDDSGWGSDDDDVSAEPGGGMRKLWRAGSRRSSRKSASSRRASRVSRRSSNASELASQSRRISAGQAGGALINPAAVHAVDASVGKGPARRGMDDASILGPRGATSPKAIEEESGTPTSALADASKGLETDPVLTSVKAQVDFGLGMLQVLVSLIPTKVQKAAEVLGFAGFRSAGLELLEKVAAEQNEWSQLASMLLLYYHTVIQSFQPESFAHARDARRLLAALKQAWRAGDMSPGALSALLSARRLRYDGELSDAVQILEESDANDRPDSALPDRNGAEEAIKAESELSELNKNVLYELGWCYLLTGRYGDAAGVFARLRRAQRTRVAKARVVEETPAEESARPALASESESAGEPAATGVQIDFLSDSTPSPMMGKDSPLNPKAAPRQEYCEIDGPWGLFYLSLEAACRWEAGEEQHPAAMRLMSEIVESAAQNTSRVGLDANDVPAKAALAPFEAHWLRLARDFTQHRGEAPLFPALETAALWNGFQQMSRADLEKHVEKIESVLGSGEVSWGNKRKAKPAAVADGQGTPKSPESTPPSAGSGIARQMITDLLTGAPQGDPGVSGDVTAEEVTSALSDESLQSAPSVSASSAPAPVASERSGDQEYGHSWSIESEMLCKFLLGCCHKHLGETEKASDELAFAISVGQNIGGHIVPFACYELGSMLLQSAATAEEGLVYLEKATDYPPHCFQGRLKFLVSERSRTYKEEKR
ncbi:hypothetical protein KFL_000220120 [Klebsormidium nitens]|uniref:Tetratricopeptide repeat-containing protein n=1 Tax=Klebsormidium nitens TaxID=105231 RepID=A0A1Y1HPS6_KLENI|nr:hypothetical protein KFL_000220120 [Klebsormidium nitens]|eukprot:GAQ78981.1 hypothetical protein KFL_000220120 [Klebsormidium nitens]